MTTSRDHERIVAIEPKQGKENQITNKLGEEKLCYGCKRSLAESPQLIDIAGQTNKWHPECFKCNICQEPMDKNVSCHIYKDKILCRNDYIRLQRDNLVDCARCRWPVGPSDWVRKAGKYVYHLACFNCDVCSRQLNTGEQFTIRIQERDNVVRLLCRLHFTIENKHADPHNSNHHQQQQQTNSGATLSSIGNPHMFDRCDDGQEDIIRSQMQSKSLIFHPKYNRSSSSSSPSIISAQQDDEQQQRQHDFYTQQTTTNSSKTVQRSSNNKSNLSLHHASTSAGRVDYKSVVSKRPQQQQPVNKSNNNQQHNISPPSSAQLVSSTSSASSRASSSTSSSSSSASSSSSSASPATSSSALSSPNGSSSLMGGHNLSGCSSMNQSSKSKRVRTTFTEDQLSILQNHFQIDSNPDGQDLERIATITGLSKRVTQVWFQNSRARQKKYMIKRKPGAHSNLIASVASITNHLPPGAPQPQPSETASCDILRNEFDFRQIVCSTSLANSENNPNLGNDLISYSMTNWSTTDGNTTNELSNNLERRTSLNEHVDDDGDSRTSADDKHHLFVVDETAATPENLDDGENIDDANGGN